MLLTPENIQNQQFNVRFRGFDVDEVDAFLEKVAENYLVLVKNNEKLTDEMAAIQGERAQIQAQERSFKNAIIAAQNIADEMQAKAKQEALSLEENARLEAAALLDDAKAQEISLKKQISALLLEKEKLKDDIHAFLRAHMDRLDSQYPSSSQTANAVKKPAVAAAPHSAMSGNVGGPPKAAPKTQAEPLLDKPLPRTKEPMFKAMSEEDDLAALYEKIDLSEIGEDGLLEQTASPTKAKNYEQKKAPFQFATDELGDIDLSMPDLDGDMLFTLDDPLDDRLGPDVTIEPPDLKKDHRRK